LLLLIAAALAHHRGPRREDGQVEGPPLDDWSPVDEYRPPTVTPPIDEVYTPPVGDDGIIDIFDENGDDNGNGWVGPILPSYTPPPPDMPPGEDPYTSPYISVEQPDKWWLQGEGQPQPIIITTVEEAMEVPWETLDTETVYDVITDKPTLREAFPILEPFLEKVDIWWEEITADPQLDIVGEALDRQIWEEPDVE